MKRYIKLYKECKGMARLLMSFFALLLALLACSMQQSVIGNPAVLAVVDEIAQLALMDETGMVPLMRDDLDSLNFSVASDPTASHYLDEIYWMVDHDEIEHIAHTVDFLQAYLETGKKYVCPPHELWHATLYVKHDELEGLPHAIEDAQQSLPIWVQDSEQKRERFPQFYLRLDEQAAEAEYAINQLSLRNYSPELIARIEYLGETASC